MLEVNSKQSGGIHVVKPKERKNGCGGKNLQRKKVFKPGTKE